MILPPLRPPDPERRADGRLSSVLPRVRGHMHACTYTHTCTLINPIMTSWKLLWAFPVISNSKHLLKRDRQAVEAAQVTNLTSKHPSVHETGSEPGKTEISTRHGPICVLNLSHLGLKLLCVLNATFTSETFLHTWQSHSARAWLSSDCGFPNGKEHLGAAQDVPAWDTLKDPCETSNHQKNSNIAFNIIGSLIYHSFVSLGMNHDDDHSSCAGRSHIMSGEWVKGRSPSDLSWSSCSRDDLENFLNEQLCRPAVFQWCRAGECVSKTPIPEHVDGDWSPWGAWSMCSRTCGTGARFRQRKCDNPPPGPGGTHCLGASVEHTVCENLPCPKGLPSFRDQQCQTHDRLSSKKKGLLTAVVVDDKPCELYCSPLGKESPLLVADRVLDGTPCGPYETDLCVHGRCQVLLFHDQNYGIHYEYTIPVNYTTENQSEPEKPQDSLFIWTHSGWEGCSVQCGGGERRSIVSCTRIVNKTTTLVNDSDCPQTSRPEPQVRRCNLHPCQSRCIYNREEWVSALSLPLVSVGPEHLCETYKETEKCDACSSEKCLTLCDPMALQPTRLFCPWDFPRQEHWSELPFLSQGIFPTQGSNPHLLEVKILENECQTERDIIVNEN
ncbi:hypothetical protein FD754_015646 [Muntiacus muntjak]|uniref:Peptidase M12B domain-containing protein n=1 Tax=Muntiacus muntjak TaxID=9888 RepID=A0A5N3VNB8_MUNMU|nr:hypothetical protein FD754_015646 [Muntiacus muntjak]